MVFCVLLVLFCTRFLICVHVSFTDVCHRSQQDGDSSVAVAMKSTHRSDSPSQPWSPATKFSPASTSTHTAMAEKEKKEEELRNASKKGELNRVLGLIEEGVDVNAKDKVGSVLY